jgi:glycosyltransferase involved in cell wall biosynthesis
MTTTNATPRILFVENQVSDFLTDRIGIVRRLQEAGYDVHVALPQEVGRAGVSTEDIVVHGIYLQRTSTWPLSELHCVVSLYRLYRRSRPALVHHIGLKLTLYGGMAASFAGVPAVVGTFTGLGYLFTTDTLKIRFLRSCVVGALRLSFKNPSHHFIFQNPEDRECVLGGSSVPSYRATLIRGSGVDLSSFIPTPEPDGRPVVLMGSRLLWSKGVGEFVDAARALRARGVRARFVLVGEPDDGHPSAVPIELLEHWRDAGDVEWLGSRHDMPDLIRQSHIICLPTSYGEGVPRILLEAAASGRPIVTTDSPGCREIVRHGQNGLLVPVGDGEALVEALEQLIANAPLRTAMGTRGRQIAVSEFSYEQVIEASLADYRTLLPGPKPPQICAQICVPSTGVG